MTASKRRKRDPRALAEVVALLVHRELQRTSFEEGRTPKVLHTLEEAGMLVLLRRWLAGHYGMTRELALPPAESAAVLKQKFKAR